MGRLIDREKKRRSEGEKERRREIY